MSMFKTLLSGVALDRLVCNNLCYIQGGKISRYAPTGDCYTNERVRPEPAFLPSRAPMR